MARVPIPEDCYHLKREEKRELALLARYVYTYEEFVIVTEATQCNKQNDSNRTEHR